MYVVWTSCRVFPLWKSILSKSELGSHQEWKKFSTIISTKSWNDNFSSHDTSPPSTDLCLMQGKKVCRIPILGYALPHKINSGTCNSIGNTITQYRCFSDNSKVVTPQDVFSDENKSRVLGKLLSMKPVKRVVPYYENRKAAAVLIPLCYVNNEPSLLFMVRSWKVPVHKGEVCFPGGMKDDVDLDLSQTALRETFEEIGLSTENVNIWGNLPKIPSKDGKIEVTPYLGFCGDMDTSKLVLDDSEVDTVFTRTLTSLCDPVNVGSTQFSNGYTLPVFLGGEFRIWGMTAILLHQALTILAPGMYNYKLRHVRPLHTKPS
ncbi:mitochondrial coenzyme A diphosphatase NUDT8-like isoform X2 [Ylistrum balloti]|uniref:mitochondrial coenzyme A diphosphatase NUDT8-like isoform X2 n=1 Tax=Ylistrum balloti TaxID=509963 RepID=UPI002905AD3B|nr:mitochondrial coenzyme A diphosphatase NUDT8-like isoform X2 [Ylistrum balloti]